MKALIAILAVGISHAASIVVTSVPTALSPTQAVVHYTPTTGPCTHTATSTTFSTTYHPDASAVPVYSVGGDNYVHFGLGSNTAALPNDTDVTLTASCNGGADTGSVTVHTPPYGTSNTFVAPIPFDSTQWGNLGWPKVDPNDPTRIYIDPQTGAPIKTMTQRGWYGLKSGQTFATPADPGSVWTNIGNLNSATNATLADCTHTSGMADCIARLPFPTEGGFGSGYGDIFAGWNPKQNVDGIQIPIFGSTSTSTADLEVCFAPVGATTFADCYSPVFDIGTLTTTPGSGTTPVSSYPAVWPDMADDVNPTQPAYFQGWGGWYPTRDQLDNNGAGSAIMLRVKSTAPNMTVHVSTALNYAWSIGFGVPGNGDIPNCSSQTFMVDKQADGLTSMTATPGELCAFTAIGTTTGVIVLYMPLTGESRLISPFYLPGALGGGLQPATWSTADPYSFYVYTGHVLRATYNPAVTVGPTTYHFRAYPHSLYPPHAGTLTCVGGGGCLPGQDTETQNWFLGPAWIDTGMSYTDIGDPNPIIAAHNTDANTQVGNLFTTAVLQTVIHDRAVFTNNSLTDALGLNLFSVLDLTTNPMTFVATGDSFSQQYFGWGCPHTSGSIALPVTYTGQGGWFWTAVNPCGGEQGQNFTGDTATTGRSASVATPTDLAPYGGSYQGNTAMNGSTGNACPTLPTPVQDMLTYLGTATPYKCITIKTPQPCNATPNSAGEAAWKPCESNAAYSQVKSLDIGDQMAVGPTGEMLISFTTAAPLGGMSYEQSYVRGTQTNLPGSQLTSPTTGWIGMMVPLGAQCGTVLEVATPPGCSGGPGWFINVDAAGPALAMYSWPLVFGGHVSIGPGPTLNHVSVIGGDIGWYDLDPFLLQQPNIAFSGSATFGGLTGAAIDLQSYPSNQQIAASSPQLANVVDQAAINPEVGQGPQFVSKNMCASDFTLVGGTSHVYVATNICGPNPTSTTQKIQPIVGWTGFYNMQDISSPTTGNVITDSTDNTFCVPTQANECRTSSTVGQVYLSSSQVNHTGDGCVSNDYNYRAPCVMSTVQYAADVWMKKVVNLDSGVNAKRISKALLGYGRQYQLLTSPNPEPQGKEAIINGAWLAGIGNDLLGVALPPSSVTDGVDRTDFIPTAIPFVNSTTAGCCTTGDTARVQFGYDEYDATNYHATPRAENTYAGIGGVTPFAWESELNTATTCASGCTVSLPLLPNHVARYRTQVIHADTTVTSGPISFVGEAAGICADVTLTPTTFSSIAAGDTGTIALVDAGGLCVWTASSDQAWLTITSGGSGTGAGTIHWSAAANVGAIRSANISLTGGSPAVWTDTQASGCTFSISPTSQSFASGGGTQSVSITASDSSCAWTDSSSDIWVGISPPSGTGSASVTVTVSANSGSSRNSSPTIAGHTFSVSQSGAAPPPSGITNIGGNYTIGGNVKIH